MEDLQKRLMAVLDDQAPGSPINSPLEVQMASILSEVVGMHETFHFERFRKDCCGECSDVESGVFVGAPCNTVLTIARGMNVT